MFYIRDFDSAVREKGATFFTFSSPRAEQDGRRYRYIIPTADDLIGVS